MSATVLHTEIAVIGGGVGGVAAALAALRRGRRVIMTEQYAWLGGQLTSQAVPPDEHPWVENFGVTASYRLLRDRIRDYYRRNYPVTREAFANPTFNPGNGTVSQLCHEPRVAMSVIEGMLAPYRASGLLTVLQPFVPVDVAMDGDRVRSVLVRDIVTGEEIRIEAPYVLDATETGELLPLSGTEYVTGAEARDEFGEPSAPEAADPQNMQAITWCFAFDHVDGDHTIARPKTYDFWREYQPSYQDVPLLSWTYPQPITLVPTIGAIGVNPEPGGVPLAPGVTDLWTYRRVIERSNFVPGTFQSDIVIANWPMNDYVIGSVIDVPDAQQHLDAARELSLSLLYWMQTEAPRPDGGAGYPGLRARGDVVGTRDGLAQAPYIRESRRIRALTTVTESDISVTARGHGRPATFADSVGVGSYRIDLHPSTGGDTYIDVAAAPFEIPLGSLVPHRTSNLIAAAKNIGTTHITNGAYRLHPVEWNVGEAAGLLADYCLAHGSTPQGVATDERELADFQHHLTTQGIELHWPDVVGS
ncbi:FAD-dependent oxidoreductase [Microbacterium sp. A588]